ncbi:hypothetical protein [Paraburkholderia acidiphila]|uniref:Uncharacterized protein n=1 Tax=Paraburkholderia acidiphila TaxID=2571747 RepID=A0A7Z2GC86_9BURK|nr:hypothetical protein [Paraburkholderia acidiphila]QGZ59072.1 hypothetical protein FAZ97_29495 [Paraburkholderia acidiphila]
MKALFHLAAAAAAGTLVMFYLDPISGPRRRAKLRTAPFSRRRGHASAHGHADPLGVDGELAGPGGGIGTAP